jgi:hypothetical protein
LIYLNIYAIHLLIVEFVRKPGQQTGSGQCDGDKNQMFQYLAAGAAVYVTGFAAVALERATVVWEAMGTSGVVQEAVEHGVAWPSLVINFFA